MTDADDKDCKSVELKDNERRRFLIALTTVMGGVGAAFAAVPFLSAWWPSERAQAAGAPIEVDLSHLKTGEQMIVEWRGKPVWIIKRNPEDVAKLEKIEERLRDPKSEVWEQQPEYVNKTHRGIKPEYLILIGVCTHLGCSPVYKPFLGELGPDWPGGFFCPCHGSMFDMAGRVFKGVPAPINLQVPPYYFLSDQVVMIGIDQPAGGAAA